MDDAALLLLLADIRHQAAQTMVDAEILRRELVGRPATEADAAQARRSAAAAMRYRLEVDMAYRVIEEGRTLRGTLRRVVQWFRRGSGRA